MPLCIDLFCGLGGWTEGFLAEGFDCIGFDIERHEYGNERYPGQLVLQDIRTLHGSQLRAAAVIVASPPCQEFSYMAMPFSRGKQIARALRGQDEFPDKYTGSRTIAELTALFDACFRIQREASEAAGRHVSMVVENVKGAQPWVGPATYHFGSFYLWGDVPALMPMAAAVKVSGMDWSKYGQPGYKAVAFNDEAVRQGRKNNGGSWFAIGSLGQTNLKSDPRRNGGKGVHLTSPRENCSLQRRASSKFDSRKAASAKIAKIPFALSNWIAKCYRGDVEEVA